MNSHDTRSGTRRKEDCDERSNAQTGQQEGNCRGYVVFIVGAIAHENSFQLLDAEKVLDAEKAGGLLSRTALRTAATTIRPQTVVT